MVPFRDRQMRMYGTRVEYADVKGNSAAYSCLLDYGPTRELHCRPLRELPDLVEELINRLAGILEPTDLRHR